MAGKIYDLATNTIPSVGYPKKYGVGDTINDTNLQLTGGLTEVWSLTDITRGISIATDPNGYIYVGYGTGQIRKLNSSGTQVWCYTCTSSSPVYCIVVDTSGNVYASINGYGLVKLNSSGALVWSYTVYTNIYQIAVDSAGNVYITNGGGNPSVIKLNSSGTLVWSASDNVGAKGIAVDSSQNVYVSYFQTSGRYLEKLNSSGSSVWSISSTYSCGWYIGLDSSGNIYMPFGNSYTQIAKFNNSGTNLWYGYPGGSLTTSEVYYAGITLDANNNIYLADLNYGLVKINSINGDVLYIKNDVSLCYSVAIDSSGYICTAHNTTSGKVVRRLKPATYTVAS